MVRNGSCHCGAVKFTADVAEPLRGARCDCSICAVKGAVTVGTPLDGLTILKGEDLLTQYRFNTGVAKHYFCSKCGIYTHHQRRSNPNQFGINVACLADISPFDFDEVPVNDGVQHPTDAATKGPRIDGILRYERNPA